MAIHVDVYTRLHDREIRRDAQQLEQTFDRAGRNMGDSLSAGIDRAAPKVEKSLQRVEKATDKVADSIGNVAREQANYDALVARGDAPREKLITQSERLEKAKRAERAAIRDAARAHQEHNRNLMDASAIAADASHAFASLTGAASGAGSAAASAGSSFGKLGPAIGAVVGVGWAAVSALVDVGKAVVTATQSLWLLPAAATAAGAGFAALKIGTLGFADAIKDIRDPEKFATALQSLSPNAQQAALSIQALLPQFDALKNSVQDSLFANVSATIQRLSGQFLPMLQSSLSGVASAFNSAFQGVAEVLSSNPQMISTILSNIQAAFQNASAAAAPFTEALLRITEVGSSFLPQLGTAIADVAEKFAAFITENTQNGKLEEWITDGINAVKELGNTIFDIGKVIYDTFGSAKPSEFKDTLNGIVTAADTVASFINKISDAWGFMSRAAQTGVNAAINVVNNLLNPLRGVAQLLNALPGVDIQIPDGLIAPVGAPVSGTAVASPGLGSGAGGGIGGGGAGARVGMGLSQPLFSGATSFAVPAPPPDKGGRAGGPKLPDAPVLPYDPTVPGGSSPGTFSEETSFLDARQKLAEKRARLDQLEKSSVATEDDRLKARNDVVEAERDLQGAEIRLNEARTSQFEKMTKTGDKYASQMGEIGAQLDQDFGISKGLSGIAENITKFVANLAAAPLLGQLDAISQANPSKGGFGAMGIAAAQGAFGPQYTGIQQQQGYGYAAAAMGPSALQPGMYGSPAAAKPGESARSFAHRVMMPFWQQQGLTVGDHSADKYGEHQNGALDLMVSNLAEGQQVLSQVLSDPNVYGAIFDNKVYGYGQGSTPRDYSAGHTGNPTQDHQDHVHAWYKPGGANNITPPMPSMAPTMAPTVSAPSPAPSLTGVPSMAGGPVSGGMPQAAPFANTQYGGITPAGGSGGGGVGIQSGGLLDTAIGVGASGLDMLAPGAGQAAQTGIKLANRAIQYGGQVAGIGAQGLMETFLPFGASELANNNWLTRIVGGLAGAAPAIPNIAGKGSQPTPEQVANVDPNTTQHGQGQGQAPGPVYNVQIDAANREPQGIAKDFEYHTNQANTAPGMG